MNAIVREKFLRFSQSGNNAVLRSRIGLEVAQNSLNMVQLEQIADESIRLHDWVTIPFNGERNALIYDHKAFKSLARQAKSATRFSGCEINAMMPASEIRIMSVNYEVNQGQDAILAIANIVADRVPGDLGDYVLDYLPVRQPEKYGKGLAVVAIAEQKKVTSYLDSLYAAGFKVNAMDIGPAAIKRVVSALTGSRIGETVLVINFGATLSYLSIVSGRRLLFDEEIRFGEKLLVEEIANALDLPPEIASEQVRNCGVGSFGRTDLGQADKEVADTILQILRPAFRQLADSLKRALVYAVAETRGEPISQIYLVGSVARWRGATDVLTAMLDLPVSTLPDPIMRFMGKQPVTTADEQISHPEMALATGLALRDLEIDGKYRSGS